MSRSQVLLAILTGLLATQPVQALSPQPPPASAKPAAASLEADLAWEDVLRASQPAPPPDGWRTTRPTQKEIARFRAIQGEAAATASEKARAFHTRFPKHSKAEEARAKEFELLDRAVALGHAKASARLELLEAERLKNPDLTEDERVELRVQSVHRNASSKLAEGETAALTTYEKGIRQLQKDFPKRSEPFEMLLGLAAQSDPEKARPIALEIAGSSASEEVKQAARDLLRKFDLVGKPLEIKVTSLGGKEIDLQKMRGKVVLVDFWATWCGPCVAELPRVKVAYDKLHPKGFEIVGISFDRQKEKLEQFVAKEKIPWPQHFDGEGTLGEKYGIESIPTMWLLDKKGLVRELNGREGLEEKVLKLLAEKE